MTAGFLETPFTRTRIPGKPFAARLAAKSTLEVLLQELRLGKSLAGWALNRCFVVIGFFATARETTTRSPLAIPRIGATPTRAAALAFVVEAFFKAWLGTSRRLGQDELLIAVEDDGFNFAGR